MADVDPEYVNIDEAGYTQNGRKRDFNHIADKTRKPYHPTTLASRIIRTVDARNLTPKYINALKKIDKHVANGTIPLGWVDTAIAWADTCRKNYWAHTAGGKLIQIDGLLSLINNKSRMEQWMQNTGFHPKKQYESSTHEPSIDDAMVE